MAVQSLRERSGLEEALTEVEESVIHSSIPKHEHPKLHSIAEGFRKQLGITGETSSERLKNLLGSIGNIVKSTTERKRMEYGEMGREPISGRAVVPTAPAMKAECEKVSVGSGDAFDIGDVEGIRIGNDVMITVPQGKHVYVISKGMGLTGSSAKRLDDVV